MESNLPPCATHHQHSQDTRNGCVKSPQDGRRCLDPWTEFQPFIIAESDLWTGAGEGEQVVLIPNPCARLITNLTSRNGVILYQWEFLRARLDEGEGLPWIAMET